MCYPPLGMWCFHQAIHIINVHVARCAINTYTCTYTLTMQSRAESLLWDARPLNNNNHFFQLQDLFYCRHPLGTAKHVHVSRVISLNDGGYWRPQPTNQSTNPLVPSTVHGWSLKFEYWRDIHGPKWKPHLLYQRLASTVYISWHNVPSKMQSCGVLSSFEGMKAIISSQALCKGLSGSIARVPLPSGIGLVTLLPIYMLLQQSREIIPQIIRIFLSLNKIVLAQK